MVNMPQVLPNLNLRYFFTTVLIFQFAYQINTFFENEAMVVIFLFLWLFLLNINACLDVW